MTRPIIVESTIHFRRRGRGSRKEMCQGQAPEATARPPGRVPRIARFMALAIRFEQLIQAGEVADYAELARLGHVTRARITQVMNLRLLAPDIQEQILFLPRIEGGREPVYLRQLQSITAVFDWRKQRQAWAEILAGGAGQVPPMC